MRASAPTALLALAALLAAGCTGPAGDAPAESTGPDPQAAAALLQPPAWAVRDWWAYRSGDTVATYVVTADLGAAWQMDIDLAERAFQDAREDISRLGPQRKSDLAGSQGAATVEFFRWPLEAGKAWTTTWDGQPLDVRVLTVEGGVARLEARNATGGLVYAYSYDAAARWFGDLRRVAPDGSDLVHLVLDGSGRNWTGTVVRWTLADAYASTGGTHGDRFEVEDTVTDLWLSYTAECDDGQGGYLVVVKPVAPTLADDGYAAEGPCGDVRFADVVQQDPAPGTWVAAASLGGNSGTFDALLLKRTFHAIPVG